MKVAQKRNAVQEGMFYFRKDIFKGERGGPAVGLLIRSQWGSSYSPARSLPPLGCNPGLDGAAASAQNGVETDGDNEEYMLMSIDTIINGKVGTPMHSKWRETSFL